MIKKFFYALSLVLLSTACNQNDLREQIPITDEVQKICATIKDFEYDQYSFSRTSITIKEDGPHYAWAKTDTIGIFPSAGRQVEFSMASGAGSTSATFTGGGWGLKSTSTYSAYFPLIGKYYLDKTQIPIDYTGQIQNGDNSTAHLGTYDYLATTASEVKNGTVAFNFERLGCLVKLAITIPEPKILSKLALNSTVSFTKKGTVNLSSESLSITPTEQSQTLEIGLNNISTTEANEKVTIYFMIAPINIESRTLTATITFDDGSSYETDITGKNLESGQAYALEEVDRRLFTSKTTAVKPTQDSNGTFLIKSASNMKWFMENCKYTAEFDYRKASYKLLTDIIFDNYSWKPIYIIDGAIFDGGNHVIENLEPNGYDCGSYAFFSSISGTVKNLVLKNPKISQSGDNDYHGLRVGVLAGAVSGTIINCGVIGGSIDVTSTSRAWVTSGGLIGEITNDNAMIKGCYVIDTKISGRALGRTIIVGGLIGSLGDNSNYIPNVENISITSCYTKDVTVSGGSYNGTFIGSTALCDTYSKPSSIDECYYDGSGNAIGAEHSTYVITTNNFESLSQISFADAIIKMNANLTNCDYKFDTNGSFVEN